MPLPSDGRRATGRKHRRRAAARPPVRTAAALTALTLASAVGVPIAFAPSSGLDPLAARSSAATSQTARGTAAGTSRTGARQAAAPLPFPQAPDGPVDMIRSREWHLSALHVPKAWKQSRGAGVVVAVLDTGVDKHHPDLTGRVITGPDLTGGTRRPGSKYWGLHGTSMASIIAGHGHGPGGSQGVMGVAPASHVMSLRVTWENDDPMRKDDAQVNHARDAIAQGIRYAVDHGATVINMSLGGGKQYYDGDSSEEDAIRYAQSKGVVLIASAGNDGAGANRKNFPAAYPGVIAVGALDHDMHEWKDSNRHPYVAVCAPGVDIVSADADDGYVVGTGTSPSSAIVAGIVALLRSRYPSMSPDQVRQALVEGSTGKGTSPSGSCPGSLDAARAMAAAARISKEPPKPSAPAVRKDAPTASTSNSDSDRIYLAILGGGGALVLIGLFLGWRQRRRPDEDDGLVPPPAPVPAPRRSAPPVESPPVVSFQPAPPRPAPPATPAAEPLAAPTFSGEPSDWTPPPPPRPVPSTPEPERFTEHEPERPSEFTPLSQEPGRFAEPAPPTSERFAESASSSGPAYPDEGEVPSAFDPLADPLQGPGSVQGAGPLSEQEARPVEDEPGLSDEEWERFRRGVLAEAEQPAPPPMPPLEDLQTGAVPDAPPPGLADANGHGPMPSAPDDAAGHSPRRRRPVVADDDDYRPPWW
ncbi:S8 family peptidase [Actinomadura rupiterrae]|uniref:S8 family peptidase n=1 Tax=Actinomadura rupiterrae TaxID=559627 RepID=UPI0020A3031C|nr:S8 family serine peptidase [Actinomadura rupiterrae]MCP2337159.1 type VII secretion-associated serine protease mycosin [Actinomadura rupiterrae]